MSVALCLRFDDKSSQAIERVWQELASAGISSDMALLGYPPHLTLLVVEDDAWLDDLAPELDELAAHVPAAVELAEARAFHGTEVVYLSCKGDLAPLFELHRHAATKLPADAIHPHYRHSSWVPHVTLQMTGNTDRSLGVAAACWRGLSASVIKLDLVTFRPIEVRRSVDIGSRSVGGTRSV